MNVHSSPVRGRACPVLVPLLRCRAVEKRDLIPVTHACLLFLSMLCSSCKPSDRASLVSGTIEVDQVRVASRYGGRVEKVLAQEGDSLQAGQPIVELEAAELKSRRDAVAAQLAELVAGPRKEEIEEAQHSLDALRADFEQAQADAKRAEQLFSQNTIAASEQERAVSHARTLEKNVAAAKSRYELLLAGTRPERLAQARANLAEIETQLREMKVVAPSNSVLEVLNVKPGDVLPAAREVATLLLPDHLWVRVYVPEPWLGHIKLGEKVSVRVDSDPGRDFPGTVEQIAREAEFTPRNVQTVGERIKQVFGIKIRLDSGEGKLRAGMAADVTFANTPK
jgi:HlyD family secretion protein